jgi:hypothetical protein
VTTVDLHAPYLACLRCGKLSIATRPLPLLTEWIRCPECGHGAAFHAILADGRRRSDGAPAEHNGGRPPDGRPDG